MRFPVTLSPPHELMGTVRCPNGHEYVEIDASVLIQCGEFAWCHHCDAELENSYDLDGNYLLGGELR